MKKGDLKNCKVGKAYVLDGVPFVVLECRFCCAKCMFLCNLWSASCTPSERPDNKNVYFKELNKSWIGKRLIMLRMFLKL